MYNRGQEIADNNGIKFLDEGARNKDTITRLGLTTIQSQYCVELKHNMDYVLTY